MAKLPEIVGTTASTSASSSPSSRDRGVPRPPGPQPTRWGFRLSVVGGNAEAARRAGLNVPVLILSALLVGGALAGLAGMIQFAGIEYKLRPGFGRQIGYIGFLASWLARHQPLPVLLAAFVFASLSVAGDSLQLDSQTAGRHRQHPHRPHPASPSSASRPHAGRRALMSLSSTSSAAVSAVAPRSCTPRSARPSPSGPASSTSAPRARCCSVRCARTPSLSRPATPGSGALAGAVGGGLLSLLHALPRRLARREPVRERPHAAVPRARPHLAVRGGLRRPAHHRRSTSGTCPGPELDIPFIGRGALRAGPARLPQLRRGPAGLVPAVPHRSRAARPDGRGALGRARPSTATASSAVRIGAVTAGGFLAGVGGAHLSIAYANSWFENMVAGRGFIAVALVIFASGVPIEGDGRRLPLRRRARPGPGAAGARRTGSTSSLLHVIPFVLTLVVLPCSAGARSRSSPAELKRVFENAPPT